MASKVARRRSHGDQNRYVMYSHTAAVLQSMALGKPYHVMYTARQLPSGSRMRASTRQRRLIGTGLIGTGGETVGRGGMGTEVVGAACTTPNSSRQTVRAKTANRDRRIGTSRIRQSNRWPQQLQPH